MKKYMTFIFFLLITILGFGCYAKTEEAFYLNEVLPIELTVGDLLDYDNIVYDENNEVLRKENEYVYANKPGQIIISVNEVKYYVTVLEEEPSIKVIGDFLLIIGESTKLQTSVNPNHLDQEVNYYCTDSNIIDVKDDGTVTALSCGIARVIVSSKENPLISTEVSFVVIDEDEKYYESIINNIISEKENKIDSSSNTGFIDAIIGYNNMSLIGVSSYKYFNNKLVTSNFGSGIIYKMNINYLDGTSKENVTDVTNEKNILEFEYYVITNRHLIENMTNVKIYYGEEQEIDANVIEYDEKIDLAVLKFKSKLYFPIAKLGNSNEIETGEFIISIGHGTDKSYFRSNTIGVISSTKRYVNTDTNNDNVNDWDSEFIQHDAAVNECDSGGAIVNLKGEIIGINSARISIGNYNNMAFAIPINLVMEIVSQLEQGIRPQRATLGVSILDLAGYFANKAYYDHYYPNLKVPAGIKYGFYVNSVDSGSISEKAGVKVDDIIIEFNGVELKYSYQIRAELGKFLIGSGEVVPMKVLRNGNPVTLYVEF